MSKKVKLKNWGLLRSIDTYLQARFLSKTHKITLTQSTSCTSQTGKKHENRESTGIPEISGKVVIFDVENSKNQSLFEISTRSCVLIYNTLWSFTYTYRFLKTEKIKEKKLFLTDYLPLNFRNLETQL